MPYTLLAIEFANGTAVPGPYLKSFDHEAHNGLGFGEFTDDPALSLSFDDRVAAMAFWQRQSRVRPYRADGKPNRPMTCLTVEVVERP